MRARLLGCAIAAASLLVCATAAGSAGDFAPAATSPETVGTTPMSVAAADFDGDGHRDLATANWGSSDVTVLLGDGSGNFTPASSSPEAAGATARSLVAADLDADGDPDLAVANCAGSSVTILLGDGTGDFVAAPTGPEATGACAGTLVAARLDGNATLDLAVANWGANTVTVLLGDGSGDFTAPPSSPEATGNVPSGITAADFDGDGDRDLAVSNLIDATVTILLGDGTGDFSPAASSPEGVWTNPYPPVAADLDADGDIDLAVPNGGANSVAILLGDGTGDFANASTSPEAVGASPVGLGVGDFTSDGRLDLVSVNSGANTLTVLAGDGAGDFVAVLTSPESVGFAPFSVAVADLTSDGEPDLAVANDGAHTVSVLVLQDALPVAVADTAIVAEDDGATAIDVLANDTDADGGPRAIATTSTAAHGTVIHTATGLTYTPSADYNGTDTFTYTLNGGSTATVTVTVAAVDDPPVAVADAVTVAEDSGATAIDVLANDTDADGGPRAIATTSTAAHGTVTHTATGLTYTPSADWNGTDTFTYTLDGGSTATVTVTVTPVPEADVVPASVPDVTAPVTRITRHPRHVVRSAAARVRVRFGFASSEPGSTFRCRIDRRSWRTCGSTLRVRVGRGRHVLRVRARDAAGNRDATPAVWRWRVTHR